MIKNVIPGGKVGPQMGSKFNIELLKTVLKNNNATICGITLQASSDSINSKLHMMHPRPKI